MLRKNGPVSGGRLHLGRARSVRTNVWPLDVDDIDDATCLSTQANWNQTSGDWRRLVALAPDSCYGGWIDDDLVVTATVVTYDGAVGWIGMVLVDENPRRRGYAASGESAKRKAITTS